MFEIGMQEGEVRGNAGNKGTKGKWSREREVELKSRAARTPWLVEPARIHTDHSDLDEVELCASLRSKLLEVCESQAVVALVKDDLVAMRVVLTRSQRLGRLLRDVLVLLRP